MTNIFGALLLTLSLAASTSAQTLMGASVPGSTWHIQQPAAVHHTPTPQAAPQTETELKYYDPQLQTDDWIIGAQYASVVSLGLGERMTLPWTSGYLDSVSFVIDSLYGDSVQLVISPDTLYDVGLGDPYHLINIFPTAPAPAARIFVQKEQIKLGGVTTIKFDHIQVPQDFYVVFVGGIDQSSNTVIPVWIRGDAEPVRTLAPESTRSAMLATNGVNLITAIIDGQYILNGRTDAAFTNFYMNAFVSQGDGAVSTASSNSDGLAVYPNPSNHTLTVAANASTGAVHSIALIDALGRNAWSSTEFDAMARIDVSALPTGSYRLVVHDDSGIHTTPISIVH